MLAAVIAEGVAIVLLGVLVLGLLRSHALILKALHELGAGLELEKEAGTGVTTATTGGKPGHRGRCPSSSSRAWCRRPARTPPRRTTSSAPTSTGSSSRSP